MDLASVGLGLGRLESTGLHETILGKGGHHMSRRLRWLAAIIAPMVGLFLTTLPQPATGQIGNNRSVQGTLTILDIEGGEGLILIRAVNAGPRPVVVLGGFELAVLSLGRCPADWLRIAESCEELVATVPSRLALPGILVVGDRPLDNRKVKAASLYLPGPVP